MAACSTVKPSASSCTRISSADLKSSSTTSAVRAPGQLRVARRRPSSPAERHVRLRRARSGSQTVKHEPSPTALSTATVPPCSSASSFTIARPSPVPSNFRARPLSIWLNGLNSCSSPSGEMPMPLSVTLISRNSANSLSASGKLRPGQAPASAPTSARGTRRGAQRHLRRRRRVNFTALDSRL